MLQYASYHFGTEEKYFAKYGYPEIADHVAEHESFAGKVTSFIEAFKAGNEMVTFDVMNFLREWLLDHIKSKDVVSFEYFKKLNIIDL